MSNDDFMISGSRPRSRSYKLQRVAINIIAVAAFVECAGVAVRDLAHKHLWYRYLHDASMWLLAVGLFVSVGALALGFLDLKTKRVKK